MAEMIYISYGYFDKALAKQVSRMIEKNGYRCFYSYTDEGTGSSSESEEVMRTSPAMVLVLGENTCKSMWIVQEVSRALSFDIPVIPVSFGGHYEVSGPLVRIIEGVETLDLEKDEDKKALLKKISAAVDMAAVRGVYMNLRRRP